MNKARFSTSRTEDAQWLMDFISDRDEIAFARLVRKYEKLVWIVCCRVLNNRCDAEDAFQATFTLLASKARKIRKPKSIASWLYGVAFRTASSIRRQKYRDQVAYQETIDHRSGVDVLEQVSRRNEIELVSAELMALSDDYKTPLIMFYFLGDSTSQIAKTMGLTVVAVESRLRRGRRALKNRLLGRGMEPNVFAAALVAMPSISISQTVISNTIVSGLAASSGSIMHLLSAYSQSINHPGAKLMIWKSCIAFGLIAILGVGVAINSGGFANEPTPQSISQLDPDFDQPSAEVEMIQDQEDQKKKSDAHEHHAKLHRHLHHHFLMLMKHLHGAHDHSDSHQGGSAHQRGSSHQTDKLHQHQSKQKQLHQHKLHQHKLHQHKSHQDKSHQDKLHQDKLHQDKLHQHHSGDGKHKGS